MKKVINGSAYNTETAKTIGSIEPSGCNTRDFNYYCETLYMTKAGKFFLHGEGNANSRYGKWTGNSGGWGSEIRPYTLEEAKKWAEKHLDGDVYEETFGEVEEAGENKVSLNLSVLPYTKAKLEKMKQETGKSISQIIDEMLAE